jgi:hypothetical protein
LITLKQAQVISIASADEFFHRLSESVRSLERLSSSHPLSAKVAAATIKRYLVEPKYRIDLHDLVVQEVERVVPLLSPEHFSAQAEYSPEELAERLRRYETLTEILRSIFIVGCYWGDRAHSDLWTKALNRVSNPFSPTSGLVIWLNLKLYPALLMLYSGGMAAIAANSYETFYSLLVDPKVPSPNREHSLLAVVNAVKPWDLEAMRSLSGLERHKTPMSEHLFAVLRESFREYLPADLDYERCFNRFEYMLALLYIDQDDRGWAPVGRFLWREGEFGIENETAEELKREVKNDGEHWPPIKAGLFRGSIARFEEVLALLQAHVGRVRQQMW